MRVSGYLGVMRRWWTTAAIALLAGGALGWAIASSIPPTYEASTRLLVGPVNADLDTLRASEALVQTYAELATSQPILFDAIQALGLDVDVVALREDLSTTPNEATRMLTIRAEHTDPGIALGLVGHLSASIQELTGQELAGAISVVDNTSVTAEPVDPDVVLLAALAGLGGLIAAVIMAVAVEYVGDHIQDAEQLVGQELPDLYTTIPKAGRRLTSSTPIVTEASPRSRSAEAYRLLSARIIAATGAEGKTVGLFGTARADGAGEVAANLAATLTRMGFAVSVIEANSDEPEATDLLSVMRRPLSRTELDIGPNDTARVGVHRIQLSRLPAEANFRLVEAIGTHVGSARRRVLNSRDAASCISGLRHGARDGIVIVSGPPVTSSSSVVSWASAADIVLLVGLLHETKLSELHEAREVLRLADIEADGLILLGGRTRLKGRRPFARLVRARSAA